MFIFGLQHVLRCGVEMEAACLYAEGTVRDGVEWCGSFKWIMLVYLPCKSGVGKKLFSHWQMLFSFGKSY